LRWSAILIASAIVATSVQGAAVAGGYPFDAEHCPTGSWLPISNEPTPSAVTNVLCKFFSAIDLGDYDTAQSLLSADFDRDSFNNVVRFANSSKLRTGTKGRPERYVVDTRHDSSDVYRYDFLENYPNATFNQEVYVRYTAGAAYIAGIRFGPN
jgi:hypothetical protein